MFGVAGTLLLLTRSLPTGILGAACIIVFLYGFFLSFSSGVPAWFDRRPGRKYQGQTLLIFRTLSAKLNTMGIVMATIALLFTAVLISQGTGLIFGAIFESRQTAETCFDIFIGTETPEQDGSDLIAYIESSIPVTAAHSYRIYQGTDARITDYLNENTDYYPCYPYDTWMKFSDYAALRSMLGYPDVTLEPGEYLIHCVPWQKNAVTACAQTIAVDGATLLPGSIHTETLNQRLWNVNGTDFILILPDEAVLSRPVSHNLYAAMTKEPVSEEQYAALCRIRDDRELYRHITLYTAPQVQAEYASLTAMLVLPLYYLALVLIMTAATILTIQQLSETDRYRRQFLLLKKLGMDRQEMHRALRLQFTIYYAMPAIPPLFVSIPFLLSLCNATDPGVTEGFYRPFNIICLTLALFFMIYAVYIVMAYRSLKRNVLP